MDAKKRRELPPLAKIIPEYDPDNEFTMDWYKNAANEILKVSLIRGKRGRLLAAIDKAIDEGDVAQFEVLVKLLNKLDERELETQ